MTNLRARVSELYLRNALITKPAWVFELQHYGLSHQHFYTDCDQAICKVAYDLFGSKGRYTAEQLKSEVAGHKVNTGALEIAFKTAHEDLDKASIESHINALASAYWSRQYDCLRETLEDDLDSIKSATYLRDKYAPLFDSLQSYAEGTDEESLDQILAELQEELQFIRESPEDFKYITTGHPKLDELLGVIRPGEVVVVAGRPSEGKSAFATGIALHNGLQGKLVKTYSYEMPSRDLALRVAGVYGGLDVRPLITPHMMSETSWQHFLDVSKSLSKYGNIKFHAGPTNTIKKIRSDLAQYERKGRPVDLVIIDHLHIFPDSIREEISRLTYLTMAIKHIAVDFNVPVILLSQLNRGAEITTRGRGNEDIPQMHHLRGCGTIEQDADKVLFVWTPGHIQLNPDDDLIPKRVAIGKNRNGPKGIVDYQFKANHTKFEEI